MSKNGNIQVLIPKIEREDSKEGLIKMNLNPVYVVFFIKRKTLPNGVDVRLYSKEDEELFNIIEKEMKMNKITHSLSIETEILYDKLEKIKYFNYKTESKKDNEEVKEGFNFNFFFSKIFIVISIACIFYSPSNIMFLISLFISGKFYIDNM